MKSNRTEKQEKYKKTMSELCNKSHNYKSAGIHNYVMDEKEWRAVLRQSAKIFFLGLSDEEGEQDRLRELAGEVKFEVEELRNGKSNCYPIHPALDGDEAEPWPSDTFPEYILLYRLAIRT